MSLSRRSKARALLAALALSCVAVPSFSQISAEAKQHFQAGVDLLNDPDGARYQEAYLQFKLAYDKSKSWKVLGNLALCEMKLERDGEAIAHYEQYLSEGAASIDQAEKDQIAKDVRVLKSGVATVTLISDSEGDVKVQDARTKTNGQTINTYDLKGKVTLTVRGGNHTFKATLGGKTLDWATDLTPGSKAEHTFKFKDSAPPPVASSGAPPATTAAPPPSSTSVEVKPEQASLRTYGYITAGVGGALILGGVVTGLMAKSKDSASKDGCIGTICPASNKSDHDSAKSLAGISTVLFIGGGLAAAAGATLIVVGGPKDKAARLQLTPTAAGVVAHGSFLAMHSKSSLRFAFASLLAVAAAPAAGCSVSDDLTFDDQKYQEAKNAGGSASGAAGSGTAGTTAGTAGTGTAGTSAGTAGSAGKGGIDPKCGTCLAAGCGVELQACLNSDTCTGCLKQPGPECTMDATTVAVLKCGCAAKCGVACGVEPVCLAMGTGGMGGTGGTAGAGGAGAAGASGAGAAGKAGGPPTYTTCNECVASVCKDAIIKCNGDAQCAPCISGNGGPDCPKNANFIAAQSCACTSDCGQLCGCTNEFCGNGKIEGAEDCEGTDLGGKTCATALGDNAAFGNLKCGSNCHFDVSSCSSSTPFCGNKKLDGGELCDGALLNGKTCATVTGNADATGQLKCTYKCGFDASGCQVPGVCGDGTLGVGEQCDMSDFGGKNCASAVGPGYSGQLKCSPTCQIDTSGCKPPATCGNGKIDGGEDCEPGSPANLNGKTCATVLGNPGATGSLKCFGNCSFDTSSCVIPTAMCGNGLKEGTEQCDKLDFGGATCASQLGKPATGPLTCDNSCKIDTSACVAITQFCGDGVKNQPMELCDGGDLAGQSCSSVLGPGWSGSLGCAPDCTFNTAGCMLPPGICGNNIPDQAIEQCDGQGLRPGTDCRMVTGAWDSMGNVACSGNCTLASNCPNMGTCGDGRLGLNEVCDPTFPGGAAINCAELYQDPTVSGVATCTGMCVYDTSQCKPTQCTALCDTNPCDGLTVCEPNQKMCVPGAVNIEDGKPQTVDFCDAGTGIVRHQLRGDYCARSLCAGQGQGPIDAMNGVGCHPSTPQADAHACVDAICKNDPFCCINGWDNLCMQHVRDSTTGPFGACNYSCQCTHSFCAPGDALFFRCDPCVEAICKVNPDCCDYTQPPGNGKWSQACVDLVAPVCHIPPSGCPG